ncbi:hypothetical protein BKI52_06825 [marine bacterium AO1-C]|nr:hypothetical protein BKI52_06825 [marine bacterium AO1-C]
MKFYFSVLMVITLGSTVVLGQNLNPAPDSPRMKRIETMRNKFIKNRLNLSPEQEKAFWPIYSKYDARKRQIRQQSRKLRRRRDLLTASDEQLIQKLRSQMKLKQQEVDLEKEYLDKFLKVINPRQVTELYRAEEEFIRRLIRQLRKQRQRRNNGGG